MAGWFANIRKICSSLLQQRRDEMPDRNGGGGDLDTELVGSIAENDVDASRCDNEMEALTIPSPIHITEPEGESNYGECLPPTSALDAKTAEAEDTKMVEANDTKTAEAIEPYSSERLESETAEFKEINSLKEPEADEAMAAEPNGTEAVECEKPMAPETDEPEVPEAVESKGPEANESAALPDPIHITQPEDQSRRGRKRAANWTPDETLKLIECRLQASLEKGKSVWKAISDQIQGRMEKQYQHRWDTLVRPYKKIKRHCDAHRKDFCHITEEEFQSMNLNIYWRNGDWYNMIDEYYRQRKVTAAEQRTPLT